MVRVFEVLRPGGEEDVLSEAGGSGAGAGFAFGEMEVYGHFGWTRGRKRGWERKVIGRLGSTGAESLVDGMRDGGGARHRQFKGSGGWFDNGEKTECWDLCLCGLDVCVGALWCVADVR